MHICIYLVNERCDILNIIDACNKSAQEKLKTKKKTFQFCV
jgi:hypothetical protein